MNTEELDRELDMINLMIRKIAAEKKLEKLRLELEAKKNKVTPVDELVELEEARESRSSEELDFEY